MNIVDITIAIIILILVGLALFCIYKNNKKGSKCCGCPSAGSCTKTNNCNK